MLMPFDITTQPGRLMLGVVYDRLYKFFKDHDEHAQHDHLVQMLLTRLMSQNPDTPILLLVKIENNQIVGHILMSMELDFGVPTVFVHQAEFDSGIMSKEDVAGWWEYVEHFGRLHNAQKALLVTKRHPRSIEKNHGFKVHRTVMIKEIQPLTVVATANGYALPERA